ncbi:MAG TPA: hypothetical protein VFD07_08005, partial [Candidatus Krumholzibacteria bacterium]|nr:hypothetical protein [Candidatus Krumholzibacteria bacterium]
AGGAIITWQDSRSGGSDIYGQRIDGAGNSVWANDGVAISTSAQTEALPTLVSFESGSAAIAWQQVSSSGETDINARRIAASGSVDGAGVIDICTAPHNQGPPRLILDGAGGALITWYDGRDRSNDIYAQRMDNPTSISLLDFTAAARPDGVALGWQLASEVLLDLEAIQVQRAPDAGGPWINLTTLPPSTMTSFVDTAVSPGQTYWYRLLLVSSAGPRATVALRIEYSPAGLRTVLYPPLVTTDGIVFRYALAVAGQPHLEILDVRGRRVQMLEPGMRPQGEHLTSWDRNSFTGTRAARGVYIVRLQIGALAMSRKLVLHR